MHYPRKVAWTERGNAHGGATKAKALFTHFLTQKHSPLSMGMGNDLFVDFLESGHCWLWDTCAHPLQYFTSHQVTNGCICSAGSLKLMPDKWTLPSGNLMSLRLLHRTTLVVYEIDFCNTRLEVYVKTKEVDDSADHRSAEF